MEGHDLTFIIQDEITYKEKQARERVLMNSLLSKPKPSETQRKDSLLFRIAREQKEKDEMARAIGESIDADEVRDALAVTIAEALSAENEALILDHDNGATGPMGGTSSRVAGYARVNDRQRSFIVAVYHDNNTDEVCDKLLDKIESRTALEDRLARVRELLDSQPVIEAAATEEE